MCVTHYVEMTGFGVVQKGVGVENSICLGLPQVCEIKGGWGYTWGGERASPLLPSQEPMYFPTLESFWEVKIWFD